MLQYPLHNHPTLRTLLLCALYAFVLLFFLSPDSYLRDVFNRGDSAWFFMCGKGWMNGMIPYVDFADSKGPLLWLIYGVGYLLSHHSFVGVFWLSVVSYTAALYISYKISRLFLDPRPAALCVALLPAVMFLKGFHYEVRTEDFCHPFVLFSLYALCRVMKEGEALPTKTFFWLCAGMGASFMACVLMKWNIGAMIGAPMLCVFILSFKQKVWALCLGGMIGGAAIFALPFMVYFLAFADFGAMVQEYFLNTFLTMDGRTSILDILTFDKEMFTNERLTIGLFICLLLSLLRYKRFAWIVLCFLLFRVCLGGACLDHYYTTLSPFALFVFIAAVSLVFAKFPRLEVYAPVCCAVLAVLIVARNTRHVNAPFSHAAEVRQEYYQAQYIMAQVKQPKLFCYRSHECGVGTPVGALPACKYWVTQKGATKEMIEASRESLEQGLPDFISYLTVDSNDGTNEEKLKSLGYVFYMTIHHVHGGYNCNLYGRPGLKLPPEDFHVSQWDVWLKRNIFGI